MKETRLRGRPIPREEGAPAARTSLRLAALFGACLVLTGAQAAGRPLPLAACGVLAVSGLPAQLTALLGAGLGNLLFWGWSGAMEPLALLLSFFAAAVLFRDSRTVLPVLGAGLALGVGGFFLIDSGAEPAAVAHLFLCAVLSAAAPLLLERALSGKATWAASAGFGLLLLGLGGWLPPLGAWAAVLAAWAVVSGAGARCLPAAILFGAGLDLTGVLPIPVLGALALSAFGLRFGQKDSPARRVLIPIAAAGLWQLMTGRLAPGFWLSAGIGAGLGVFLPEELLRWLPELPETAPASPAPEPRRGAERALQAMHKILSAEDAAVTPTQLEEVYDFAEEQVCRCCVRSAQCWEQNAEDTYHDLCSAGAAMMLRGTALREDLPDRFTARCRHTEGFLTAVNQALDAAQVRKREERRLAEGRRIAADQYLFLSRLLRRVTEPRPEAEPCYRPELAVGAAARNGETVSGDRGATCRDRFGNFYVLLCDGMGAGPAARTESDRAVHLLTDLLESGVEADSALELLNDFYALRRATVFSTVDLLKLSLCTGEGVLYKWGAAPSYLRIGGETKKIGTATLPPGLEAGENRVPGQYALSLKEGETLVMVSDGAYGDETEQLLTDFSCGSVRDLASCLITLGRTDASDDRTAVVLRLRPRNLKTA